MRTLLEAIKSGDVQLSVGIDFYCVVPREQYDLGLLTLKRSVRSLILDVTQSYTDDSNNHTYITCDLEFDEEVIEGLDSKSDLKESDLLGLDEATLFIGDEFEIEPESITLFVKSNGSTRAIELEID